MKKNVFRPLAGLLLLAALVLAAVPVKASVKSTAYTARTTTEVNLRSSKSTTADNIVKEIPKGKIVSIVKRESNNWFQVQYGTTKGYVKSTLLEDNPDVYVTIENARLRTSKSTANLSNLIGTIREGREMELIESQSGGWMYVNYRGYIGYIQASSLAKAGSIIDLKDVKFESITAVYDGKAQQLPQVENLPDGVTVSYDINENPKNIGVYEVTATFAASASDTKLVNGTPRVATLTIGVEKGKVYTVNKLKYTIATAKTDGSGTVKVSGGSSKNITEVIVPDQVKIGGVNFKVVAVANSAFTSYKKIEKVELGKNITEVGCNAFRHCAKLKTVVLGKGVKKIRWAAFYNCTKLTKMTIRSSGLTYVAPHSLGRLSKTVAINVPNAKISAYKKLFKGKGLYDTARVY